MYELHSILLHKIELFPAEGQMVGINKSQKSYEVKV